MHWIRELFIDRGRGGIGGRRGVINFAERDSIRSPTALEGARFRIENHDPFIHVAVSDVNFVSGIVDFDSGGAAENRGVLIIFRSSRRMANFQQQFPFACKFQDLAIVGACAADPNVSLLVDTNSVFGLGPVRDKTWAAPRPQHFSLRIKFQYRRRGYATLRTRRSLCRSQFVFGERSRTVQDPDVILGIDGEATDLPDDPIVGKLLRPPRIHFVIWRFLGSYRWG